MGTAKGKSPAKRMPLCLHIKSRRAFSRLVLSEGEDLAEPQLKHSSVARERGLVWLTKMGALWFRVEGIDFGFCRERGSNARRAGGEDDRQYELKPLVVIQRVGSRR